jgi:hypothetical protein
MANSTAPMENALADNKQADLRAAMRTLPAPLQAAPLSVRREWFLAKARQYLFLRVAALAFTIIFAVVLTAQLIVTPEITVATLLFPLLAMAASMWAAAAMQRARRRNTDAANILHTMEPVE